jgi:hypothetical protein
MGTGVEQLAAEPARQSPRRAFLNYAIWESMADFKRAFFNPEFQARLAKYPPSAVVFLTCSARSRCRVSA